MAARIDPELLFGRHRAEFSARLVEALATRTIGYWWLPDYGGDRSTLCFRDADRPAILGLLADLAGPAWYLDTIGADGARAYRYGLASDARQRPYDTAPGLLVWEVVTPREGSTFVADEAQA